MDRTKEIQTHNNNDWPEQPQSKRIDPGVDTVSFAHNNMRELVAKISNKTLEELTLLRDEIDSLMIAIRNRNEQLVGDITRHTEFCVGAINTKKIVSDSVKAIRDDFLGNPMVITSNQQQQ